MIASKVRTSEKKKRKENRKPKSKKAQQKQNKIIIDVVHPLLSTKATCLARLQCPANPSRAEGV
jgi:hypothetical protein